MNTDHIGNQGSCADAFDAEALSVEAAMEHIAAEIEPVRETYRLKIRDALGRTLAEDIRSVINVPAHTNSAMDGYAVRADDLPDEGTAALSVTGTAWAGKPFRGTVGPGECVRIMTGAMIPEGADTVIMQEQVESAGDRVRIGGGHRPGQNVRQAGEDLAVGETAIAAGRILTPAELGLIASLGISEAAVTRRLRVAFFATGDELRGVGEPLAEGEIYDSNRYTLYGMLTRLGAELIDLGVIADNQAAIRGAFRQAAERADVIITTGGVSVGEADYVRDILAGLGKVNFWKLAIKPGRPLAFGKVGSALFFGLPGNPVAVMVTFYQFVQPALRRMMGQTHTNPGRFEVPCMSRLGKKPGRMEFQRGQLQTGADGKPVVYRTGAQGSGILSSMSAANCFIILPATAATIEPGDMVSVEPFAGLV